MSHRCLIQTQMAMHIPDVSQQPLEFELLHCPGCGNHYSSCGSVQCCCDTLYERLPDARAGTDEVQLLDLTDDEESMTLHVYRHYMRNLSDRIEHWQVVRREAEEKSSSCRASSIELETTSKASKQIADESWRSKRKLTRQSNACLPKSWAP